MINNGGCPHVDGVCENDVCGSPFMFKMTFWNISIVYL